MVDPLNPYRFLRTTHRPDGLWGCYIVHLRSSDERIGLVGREPNGAWRACTWPDLVIVGNAQWTRVDAATVLMRRRARLAGELKAQMASGGDRC